MLEIFTTREIVLGFYLCVAVICVFCSERMREYGINLIKCASNKILLRMYFALLLYTLATILLFQRSSFWDWIYLKDVLLWVVFVGVVSCFRVADKKADENLFRKLLIENIEITAIIEFVLSYFTFGLFVEFVIQTILIAIVIFRECKITDDKLKQGKETLDKLLAMLALIIVGFTIKMAIDDFAEIDFVDLTIEFFIPIICTLAFMPIVYSIGLVSKYQTLFIRISDSRKGNEEKNRKRKIKAFLTCGLSYKKICRFEKQFCEYATNILQRYDDKIFYKFVEVFKVKKEE